MGGVKQRAHNYIRRSLWTQLMPVYCCPPTGCNPVLDGTASAQNGLESDGTNEEYTLMSIDTIINGKVTDTTSHDRRVYLSYDEACDCEQTADLKSDISTFSCFSSVVSLDGRVFKNAT